MRLVCGAAFGFLFLGAADVTHLHGIRAESAGHGAAALTNRGNCDEGKQQNDEGTERIHDFHEQAP